MVKPFFFVIERPPFRFDRNALCEGLSENTRVAAKILTAAVGMATVAEQTE